MISNHSQFLEAIGEKKRVRIEFYSHADAGTVDRECAPLDYGAEPGAQDGMNRYWVWDFADTAGANPLGLLPGQIVAVQILGTTFEPDTLALGSRHWTVPRPWSPPRAENLPRTALPRNSPAHRKPA